MKIICLLTFASLQSLAWSQAPFCVITSYSTDCWYYSASTCRDAANRANGMCVPNSHVQNQYPTPQYVPPAPRVNNWQALGGAIQQFSEDLGTIQKQQEARQIQELERQDLELRIERQKRELAKEGQKEAQKEEAPAQHSNTKETNAANANGLAWAKKTLLKVPLDDDEEKAACDIYFEYKGRKQVEGDFDAFKQVCIDFSAESN